MTDTATHQSSDSRLALPGALLAPLLAGSLAALAGGYLDDAWHTERGRDDFFIAPHLAIYGGISVVGAALSCWILLAVRAAGPGAVARHRPLVLSVLAVALTLVSAPIDNAWHLTFGRDAVIWSPPHTLGIVGTAALGVALLVEANRSAARWAPAVRPVAGAFVLAALSFLVVEYETDVPQFASLWYLPVLGTASALALGIVRRVTPGPWAATNAAAVQLAFVALVSALLAVLGFDLPRLPLLVVAALALDVLSRRDVPVALRAVAYSGALFAVYVPAVNLLGDGVRLDAGDVAIGLPLTVAAVTVALAVTLGERRVARPLSGARLGHAAVICMAVLAIAPAAALAHDPGQGDPAGTIDMRGRTSAKSVSLTAVVPPALCREVTGGRLVARRAGIVRTVPLHRRGCELSATARVPQRGIWFTYADLRRRGQTVESWLALKVGEGRSVRSPRRFAYVADRRGGGTMKVVAGIALYGLVAAMLAAVVALVRSADGVRRTGGSPRSAAGAAR